MVDGSTRPCAGSSSSKGAKASSSAMAALAIHDDGADAGVAWGDDDELMLDEDGEVVDK